MDVTNRPQWHSVLRVIGLVLILVGCMQADAVATNIVHVQDNRFEPRAAQVPVGDNVTWTWEGNNNHVVVADAFASDAQVDGEFMHRFDQPGTYDYRCTFHGA